MAPTENTAGPDAGSIPRAGFHMTDREYARAIGRRDALAFIRRMAHRPDDREAVDRHLINRKRGQQADPGRWNRLQILLARSKLEYSDLLDLGYRIQRYSDHAHREITQNLDYLDDRTSPDMIDTAVAAMDGYAAGLVLDRSHNYPPEPIRTGDNLLDRRWLQTAHKKLRRLSGDAQFADIAEALEGLRLAAADHNETGAMPEGFNPHWFTAEFSKVKPELEALGYNSYHNARLHAGAPDHHVSEYLARRIAGTVYHENLHNQAEDERDFVRHLLQPYINQTLARNFLPYEDEVMAPEDTHPPYPAEPLERRIFETGRPGAEGHAGITYMRYLKQCLIYRQMAEHTATRRTYRLAVEMRRTKEELARLESHQMDAIGRAELKGSGGAANPYLWRAGTPQLWRQTNRLTTAFTKQEALIELVDRIKAAIMPTLQERGAGTADPGAPPDMDNPPPPTLLIAEETAQDLRAAENVARAIVLLAETDRQAQQETATRAQAGRERLRHERDPAAISRIRETLAQETGTNRFHDEYQNRYKSVRDKASRDMQAGRISDETRTALAADHRLTALYDRFGQLMAHVDFNITVHLAK